MDKYDLYNAVGELDENILERSEKRKKRIWLRLLICLICVFIVASAVILPFALNAQNDYTPIDSSDGVLSTHLSFEDWAKKLVSNAHTNFEILSRKPSDAAIKTEDTDFAIFGDYFYYIKNNKIAYIEHKYLSSENLYQDIGIYYSYIEGPASKLYAFENSIAVIYQELWQDSHTYNTVIKIYDVSNPAEPTFKNEYLLLGDTVSSYIDNGIFYLFAYDGLSDCGFSRENGYSAYYPTLSKNQEEIDWSENEISIIGDPTSLGYISLLKLDITTGDILQKRAFYCDAAKIYHGDGWFAFLSKASRASSTNEPIYFFDSTSEGTDYLGYASTSVMLGLNESEKLSEEALDRIKDHLSVSSIVRFDGIFRLIGYYNDREKIESDTCLYTATVDFSKEEYRFAKFEFSDTVQEIYYENDKSLIIHAHNDELNGNVEKFTFSAIGYSGLDILHVNFENIDVALFGDNSKTPFYEPMIPLENSVYVWYNQKLDGFNIFDFSDMSKPKFVLRTPSDGAYSAYKHTPYWSVCSDRAFEIVALNEVSQEYHLLVYNVNTTASSPIELKRWAYKFDDLWSYEKPGQFHAYQNEGKRYFVEEVKSQTKRLDYLVFPNPYA